MFGKADGEGGVRLGNRGLIGVSMESILKFLRLLYRVPLMLLHLLIGTPVTVACQYSWGRSKMIGGVSLAAITSRWWSSVICIIFGIRRRKKGEFVPGAQLVAANHISFLDISVFHSFATMGFVAKAEIDSWPLLGGLARAGQTVFHRRGSHDSASGVAAAMVERLNEDRRVAIFPEGGILPGTGVKRFHARMFAAAIDAGKPVQPVMIRYLRDGSRYDDITFLPGEHFAANFSRLLMQKTCTAEVQVLPLIAPEGMQRRQLAGEAESRVRGAFESEISDG